MMDIENLLKELKRAERYCLNDYSRMAGQAATALSTLQGENERLRAELERVTAERDAAVERLREWEDPFAVDPDSGLYHLQHIATNISFLLKMRREGKA